MAALSASYTSRDSTHKNGAAKISSRDLTDGWAKGVKSETRKDRNRNVLFFSFFLNYKKIIYWIGEKMGVIYSWFK